ncbi:hypothetical protein B0T14DRAFT_569083 [Immersiella caudata]|uniref:Actin-like ATPase domain-containing protein n=1 Tax=Immersiella caudata TaxID=314043 RepID=A0AA39WLG8_9PEZI|nr:hypothetical protein B0T14DRAFT_569083 [Immersiella caudata]
MNPNGSRPSGERLVVCIDYGTTYSGAAWAMVTDETPPSSDQGYVVDRWEGTTDKKVPSEITYDERATKKWGAELSDQPGVIRETKLTLPKPSLTDALDHLAFMLSSASKLNRAEPVPLHLLKSSEAIITDYLGELAAVVRTDVRHRRGLVEIETVPIELIITHPGQWDDRARNITFRAAVEGFRRAFSEHSPEQWTYRLVTEPEACARYTIKECFIVVDGGGGTVDVVSYQVTGLSPNITMRKVSEEASDPCGSTFIDKQFMEVVLPERLGPEEFRKLSGDAYVAGHHTVLTPGLQDVRAKFLNVKHRFRGSSNPDEPPPTAFIELPEGVCDEDIPDRNIKDGSLILTCRDMEEIFDKSMSGTLNLIRRQIGQIRDGGFQPRTIFLSGGLSRSDYFYERIKAFARNFQPRINVLRGPTGLEQSSTADVFSSWMAVARGGLLIGLGVDCVTPAPSLPCPFHLGFVLSERFALHKHPESLRYTDSFDKVERAKNHIKWVISKGDLVPPDKTIEQELKLVHKMSMPAHKPGSITAVLSWEDSFSGLPGQLDKLTAPQIVKLEYSFETIPKDMHHRLWRRVPKMEERPEHCVLTMQLDVSLSHRGVDLTLLCGKEKDLLGNTATPGYALARQFIPFGQGFAR